MTNEEKIKILNEGIELLEQAEWLDERIDKTFAKIGIVVCGGFSSIRPNYSGKAKSEIHVYKGIKKLSKLLETELYHPEFYKGFGEEHDKLALVYGDYEFFESGDKIQRGYSFK